MKWTILFVAGLAIIFSFSLSPFAGDPPHNTASGVSCASCHGTVLVDSVDSPFWNPDARNVTGYNRVCTGCHNNPITGGPYGNLTGPFVLTHSPGGTAIQCTACHNNHDQDQIFLGKNDKPSFFIATATGTGLVEPGDEPGTTKIFYSGWSGSGDWSTPENVMQKTGELNRGAQLVPDRNSRNRWEIYMILDVVTGGSPYLVVKGTVASAPNIGIFYGQLINREINFREVRFWDRTGDDSFVNTDGSGICQVCHTTTDDWKNDGVMPAAGVHAGMSGASDCAVCHIHTRGLKHGGPGPTETCSDCHDSVAHPAHLDAGYYCAECHDIFNMRDGSSNILFKDGELLSGTDVCVNCHTTKPADWAGTACLTCHTASQGNRAAVGEQLLTGNSHHIQGPTPDDTHCYQCHWEADDMGHGVSIYHGGEKGVGDTAVNLVIWSGEESPGVDIIPDEGSRPKTYTLGTTAVEYTAGVSRAEIEKINDHCLGCHSDQNNSTVPFGVADGKTPRQYAWDGTSVDARYSQNLPTDKTTWGKYDTARIASKQINKAYSAHGNAGLNVEGWNTTTGVDGVITDFTGAVNVVCFDCHNSHGSTAGDGDNPTTSYASATTTGGILKDTVAGKGGYAVDYTPQGGGSLAEKNVYKPGAALCFDCHMTPDGSADSKPWGYQATFEASKSIMGYWDSPYFGDDTFGSQQRYGYKSGKGHQGGHFGASAELTTGGTNSINGLCTPCHDPHGVSPTIKSCSIPGYYTQATCVAALGVWSATPQYAVPLLKGTWVTSPYKEDVAPASDTRESVVQVNAGNVFHIDQNTFGTDISPATGAGITQNDSQFAGLCLQCHPKTELDPDDPLDPDGLNHWKGVDRIHDTVKGWGSTKHRYTCSKCHTPHNSRLERLMVTNCLDTVHKGQKAHNSSPVLTGSGSNECSRSGEWCVYDVSGSGNGSFIGQGGGFGGGYGGFGSFNYNISCHEGEAADQKWNDVTQWVNYGPTVPALVDEPNTSSTNITLEYSSTDVEGDAITYNIEIDDASDFSSKNYISGWISATSYTLTVGNNTRWYWRVKATDGATESGWSATKSFMVSDGTAPGQVTLASPANGAKITNYPGNVTFTWNAQPPLAQYRLWVDDDSGFGSPYYDSGWITATSQAVNMTAAGTYYWRVQARDSVSYATGAVSATRNIVVNKPPGVPGLVDELDTTSTSITLDWGTSTDPEGDTPVQYLVWVDEVSDFSSPNYVRDWAATTSYSFTGTVNIWYWKVKAKDALGNESAWSSVDTFYVYISGAPAIPTLLWPPDNYYDQVGCCPLGTNPLQWNASAGATSYYAEYWGGATGNSGWIAGTSFNPGDLFDNLDYYWRVKARNGFGESGWSTVWSWYDFWAVDSCPFIFTWDGSEYKYETDIQGPVIGLPSVTPAARSVVLFRPSSVVLNNLIPDNGKYLIKLRETLEEITYLDEVKLLVVDYPSGYELVSSTAENTYSYSYVNPETIYTVKDPRPPVSAFATNGDDILASVIEVDNVFAPLDYDEPEYITLDFGAITNPANAKLVIEGWTIYSAGLRTNDPVQPHIEVLDPDGNWVGVVSFGEPAGDLKRIAIPLYNVFQNSDQRIRLHLGKKSGGRWRLDRVMFDESVQVPITVSEVEAVYADLNHGGRVSHNFNSLSSRIFAEDDILPDDPGAYGYGKFTRYGDVISLLSSADDKFVIMRHGDAVSVEFPEVQAPGTGLTRSYLLKTDLYYKSFRVENNVEPLPFHGMSIYPPAAGESYPTDSEHVEYLETYNTREFIE